VGHPVQPPAEAGSPTAGCTGRCNSKSSPEVTLNIIFAMIPKNGPR